jgi:ankyrin repeat protein
LRLRERRIDTMTTRILIALGFVLFTCTSAFADDLCGPIESAALAGNNAEIDALIAKGASVNCQFSDGWTSLMHAVYGKKLDTVNHLLKSGADPNQVRKDGVTALQMAKAGQVLGMGDAEVKLYAAIEAALKASGATN